MKRAIVLLASVLFVLTASPPLVDEAEAVHKGTNCRLHNGPDGAGGVSETICITVNERDFPLLPPSVLEALGFADNGSCLTDIQVDREGSGGIELRRGRPSDPNPPNEIVRRASRPEWHKLCGDPWSTSWYEHCPSSGAWDYRGTTRYRLRWRQPIFPNAPISQWYVLGSIRRTWGQC